MNFGEAIEALKEGKKVTRPSYGIQYFYANNCISPDGEIVKDLCIRGRGDNNVHGAYLWSGDVFAEDWEIYDESVAIAREKKIQRDIPQPECNCYQ